MFEEYPERAAKVNVIKKVVRTEFPDAIAFVVFRDVFDLEEMSNAVDIEMASQISMEQLGGLLIQLGNELEEGKPPDAKGVIDTDGNVTMDDTYDNGN